MSVSEAAQVAAPCPTAARDASATAIIGTLGEASRRDSLLRAVRSLIAAAPASRLTITAVVNGNRYSASVIEDLKANGVHVLQIAQASLPAALLAGRRSVETQYFCFLDDDDEYLPGAIDRRRAALEGAPDCALVASNGYRRRDGTDTLALTTLASLPPDPLAALFRENWLPSCGALFRTSQVGVELFESPHQYLEWTWLAFRIALTGKRVAVLDEPTFRIHDTPSSLSKTPSYLSSHVSLYERMLREPLPHAIQLTVRKRLATALGMESVARLADNDLSAAWRCHLQTLKNPGGWRYGSQTLRLMAASLRHLVSPGSSVR